MLLNTHELQEMDKLFKLISKYEKKFIKAEHQPLIQKRILKKALAIDNRLCFLLRKEAK